MNKCVICKSDRDLFDLDMDHLQEELGRENIQYKLCGTCWETIFEVAYKAASKVINDRIKALNSEFELLKALNLEGEKKLDDAKVIFLAYKKLAQKDSLVVKSLEGRSYIFMHHIRHQVNQMLDSDGHHFSPQSIGHQIRKVLELEVGKRQGRGLPVYVNNEKIRELSEYYGCD